MPFDQADPMESAQAVLDSALWQAGESEVQGPDPCHWRYSSGLDLETGRPSGSSAAHALNAAPISSRGGRALTERRGPQGGLTTTPPPNRVAFPSAWISS